MSEKNAIEQIKIPEHVITVPSLNDVGYAAGLNKAFENINDNFLQLANKDFVKGNAGDSVIIKEIDLLSPDNKKYLDDIKKVITNRLKDGEATAVVLNAKKYSLWRNLENITDENEAEQNPSVNSTLKMLYSKVLDSNGHYIETPISSLYFVFLDGRFVNDAISAADEHQFTNITDASCVIIYDGGEFKVLDNAFPTMYYELGVGLCWKVNGNNTGMPVRGLPGRDGHDSRLFLAKSDSAPINNVVNINSIFDVNSYIPVSNFINNNIIAQDVTYSAIIICPKTDNTAGTDFYFGNIRLEIETVNNSRNHVVKGYCDTANSLNLNLGVETILNSLKQININSTSSLPGLFLPVEEVTDINASQKSHLLSAISIKNTEGDKTELNRDVIFTPVNDINEVQESDLINNHLQVDKYLYIKINTGNVFTNFCDGINAQTQLYLQKFLSRFNYTLKYKLNETIKNITPAQFSYSNPNVDSDSESNSTVMPLVGIGKDNEKWLVKYRNPEYDVNVPNTGINQYLDFFDSNNNPNTSLLPVDMCNNLNINDTDENPGLYLWTLDFTCHDFDPDELKTSDSNKNASDGNYNYYINLSEVLSDIPVKDENGNEGPSPLTEWLEKIIKQDPEHKDYDTYPIKDKNDLLNSCKEEQQKQLNQLVDEFVNMFRPILTTTMSPVLTSTIYWHNGFTRSVDSDGIYTYEFAANENNLNDKVTYTLIEGWQYIANDLFSIYRYIPVYKNDFRIEDDTVLNINYNVNITGDEASATRNLTVHGGINCEDLQVYNLSAAGEIKHIYTKDDILTEKGIYLGYKFDKETGNTIASSYISGDGEIYAKEVSSSLLVTTPTVSCNEITTPFVQIIQDNNYWPGELEIKNEDTDGTSNTEPNETVKAIKQEGGIYATDINKINIIRPAGPETIEKPKSKAGMARATVNTGEWNHWLNGSYTGTTGEHENFSTSNGYDVFVDPDFIAGGGNIIVGGGNLGNAGGGGGGTGSSNSNINNSGSDSAGSGLLIPVLPDTNPDGPDTNPDTGSGDNDITIVDNGYITPTGEVILQLAEYQPVITSSVPINSIDNAPIIVSNQDMSSQQLCAPGIAKNYYDGETEYLFKDATPITEENAATAEHEYVKTVDCETAKNFNIQRSIISNKEGTKRISETNSVTLHDMYSSEETPSEISKAIKGGYRQCYYQIHQRGNAQKAFKYDFRPGSVENISKDSLGFLKYGPDTDVKRKYMHKVSFSNDKVNGSTYNASFDTSAGIEIKLNKVYNTLIALLAKTSHGDTTRLLASNTFVKIRLAYTITPDTEPKLKYVKGLDKTIKLSNEIRWSSSYGKKCTENKDANVVDKFPTEADYSVYGDSDKGIPAKSVHNLVKLNGPTWDGSYGWRWRFRSFNFFVDGFSINSKTTTTDNVNVLDDIKTAYNAGKIITFYILPEFSLNVECEDGKSVVSGAYTTIPVSITGVSKNISSTILTDANASCGTYSSYANSSELYCKYSYSYTEASNNENSVKSTTITQNGIVFRDGMYTFGIGCGTDGPEIFMYDYSANDENKYKSISLADIFKSVSITPPVTT